MVKSSLVMVSNGDIKCGYCLLRGHQQWLWSKMLTLSVVIVYYGEIKSGYGLQW